MKIERLFYGMTTSDGKISLVLTPGVRSLLSQKNIEFIKKLKPEDSHRYLWFRAEQVLAYPVVTEVADRNPNHGGRTWVQNQTFLVGIHDFIGHYLNNGGNVFEKCVLPELAEFPVSFEALTV